jgi:NAD(P)-dependent dehydrogenase (short-subunit alcohol dehydrogenase family)
MSSDVVVVIGAGGIGRAIARRQGAGRTVLLADYSQPVLDAARGNLENSGHTVSARHVDVSSRESVRALAQAAAGLGPVVNVVNTAGLSPVQAPPAAILAVDLVGTALVFEEFGAVIAPGGAGLVISSMAGHMPPPLDLETARLLGQTPPTNCWPCRCSASRRCRTPVPPTLSPSRPTTPAPRPPRSPGASAGPE